MPRRLASFVLRSFGSLSIAKRRLMAAARARVRRPTPVVPAAAAPRAPVTGALKRAVVVGSSTGGPQALSVLVPRLPALPGVAYLGIQHMPAWLSPWIVERLDALKPALTVRLAEEGDAITPGTFLVAPGDRHLRLDDRCAIRLDDSERVNRVRPSVDVTLESVADVLGDRVVAVILTGIGEDGAVGAAKVRARGGQVLAEDRSTCVVWGMPRAVTERGIAHRVVALEQMAEVIQETLRAN